MAKEDLHKELLNNKSRFSGLNNLSELQEKLKENIEQFNKEQKLFYSNLFSGFQEIVRVEHELVQNGIKSISNIFKSTDNCFTDLYRFDWYLSLIIDISELSELSLLLKSEEKEKIDNFMANFYEKYFNYLSDKIVTNHPHRSNILNSAFKAHLQGEFNLSIPVFFTQIEGICQDKMNTRYYSIKNNRPKTSNLDFGKYNATSIDTFFVPLEFIGNDRKQQELNKPFGLNRHDVLHGNSFDYGTKLNSFKVFSTLVYVNEISEIFNNNGE